MKKLAFIVIFISVMQILSAADETVTEGNIRYRIGDRQASVISVVSKNVPYIVIPNEINGMRVTSIEDDAFSGCTSLTKITLPNGVIHIGNRAFFNCRMLVSITLPNSVISIGTGAFHNCYSLAKVTMPTFLVNIAADTFHNCRSLVSINVPVGVTSIGERAFSGCKSLTDIILPETVMRISSNAFEGCSARPRNSDIVIDNMAFSNTGMMQMMNEHIEIQGSDKRGAFMSGRNVSLSPFSLGQYPVSVALFHQVMGTNFDSTADDDFDKLNDTPLTNVSVYQAITFCNKLSIKYGLHPCYRVSGIDDWMALAADDIPTVSDDNWDNAIFEYDAGGYRLPTEAEIAFAARNETNSGNADWADGYLPDAVEDNTDTPFSETPNALGIYGLNNGILTLCNDRYTKLHAGTFHNPIMDDHLSGHLSFGMVRDSDKTVIIRTPVISTEQNSCIGLRLARTIVQSSYPTVTFCLDKEQVDTVSVIYGQRSELLPNPTSEGKVFVGWFADEQFSTLYNFNSPVTQDIRLFGKFIDRKTKITAPSMMTVIRKNMTADLSTDKTFGIYDMTSDIILTPYQLSNELVNRSLFAAIMGIDPTLIPLSETNFVQNVNIYQAVTFCNKLSIRAGRQPCYQVEGISDWLGLAWSDIPTYTDETWDAMTKDLSADGYRLPTPSECIYAAQNETNGKNSDGYYCSVCIDNPNIGFISFLDGQTADQWCISSDTFKNGDNPEYIGQPSWYMNENSTIRLARTIK